MPRGLIVRVALLIMPLAGTVVAYPPQAQAANQNSPQITLNLKAANLKQVAQMVSAITGKNFIVDPRAQGRVTVISSKPISASALFSVFQSVLQVHGLAAMPAGHNVWKIVPSVEGRQMPGTVSGTGTAPSGDAMVTNVIQLKNVQVAQLVPALRPLMSSNAQLAAYPPSNMLIISGRAANVHRIVRLAHRLDQPLTGDVEILHLHHSSVVNVAQVLTNMLGSKTHGQIPMKLAADPRNNTLLVSGSPVERLEVRVLVKELDSPSKSNGNTQVIYLHYASAHSLAKIVQGFIKAGRTTGKGGKGHASGSETGTVIVPDKALNALIVTASQQKMREIKHIIAALDVRRAQVLVQGIIAELSSNVAAQLGITWAALSSGAAALTNFPNGIVNLGSLAASGSSSGSSTLSQLAASGTNLASSVPGGLLFGIGRLVKNGTSFGALLNALASNTSTNILSTPSLVTLDNEQAELVSGQNVPFVTGQYTNTGVGTTGSTGVTNLVNPFQTIEREQLGLTLKIKPQINYGGDTVTLNIDAIDKSLAPSVQGASGLITNNRQVKTTVVARNKQIVVLGGLISTNLSQTRQKVPVLGDIPLIGDLFRYRSSQKQRENLMIFLRPVILKSSADTEAVTRPRYNQIREFEMGREKHIPLLPGVRPPVIPPLPPATNGNAATVSQPSRAGTPSTRGSNLSASGQQPW